MKLLSLLALLIGSVVAQTQQVHENPDCQFVFTLTSSGAFLPSANGFDNRQTGCVTWAITYSNYNFSAVSLAFETAADNSGVPSTFATGFPVQQTVFAGANPQTSTAGGFLWLTGANAWTRVKLTATGTGQVKGTAFGWKIPNAGESTGNTFSLVSVTLMGSDCAVSSSCSITIPATVAGHVGVLQLLSGNAANISMTAVSGGGTWVVPSGANAFNGTSGALSAGYNLSLAGGVTSLTATLSTGTSLTRLCYWEFTVSPGPAALDTTCGTGAANKCNLTLTGTRDVIISGTTYTSGAISSVASPFTNIQNIPADFIAAALNLNAIVGTGPTWTGGVGGAAGNSIAIK